MSPEYTKNLTTQEVGHAAAYLNVSGSPEALMRFVFWAQQRAFESIALAEHAMTKIEDNKEKAA
jgi:hypothetical protein